MYKLILSTEEKQYNVKVSMTDNVILVESDKTFNNLPDSTKLLFIGQETWAISGKHYFVDESAIYFPINEVELKKLSI